LATQVTLNIAILTKIYNNLELFRLIRLSVPKFIDNIVEALAILKEDNIMIYFAELGLYSVFDPDTYQTFCKSTYDKIDDGILITPDIYQVVLSSHKQKLVFACSNQEYIEELKKHAEECFKKTAKLSRSEINVNVECKDNCAIYNMYDDLYAYLESNHFEKYCQSINQIPCKIKNNYKFRLYNCSDNVNARLSDQTIQSILRNIPPGTPVNIIIGNNNTMNNITNNAKDREEIAKQWVKDNPPTHREATTHYYNRYKVANSNSLPNTMFGPIVTNANYNSHRNGNVRYWIKA
jgi:hypothetical protein